MFLRFAFLFYIKKPNELSGQPNSNNNKSNSNNNIGDNNNNNVICYITQYVI